jgi:hypothetical protein
MEKTRRDLFVFIGYFLEQNFTLRISSSTTVKGIPRIFIRYSPFRLAAGDERRTGLRLRLRRRLSFREPRIE